jgi:hypothetical protein
LTDEGWAHILNRHADLAEYLYDIREAIELANEVRRDATYDHRDIHYRHRGAGSRSLRVVVQYQPLEPSGWVGHVITAHFLSSQRSRKEALLWPIPEQI